MDKCLQCEMHKVTWRDIRVAADEADDYLRAELLKLQQVEELVGPLAGDPWEPIYETYYKMLAKDGLLSYCEERVDRMEEGVYEMVHSKSNSDEMYVRKLK